MKQRGFTLVATMAAVVILLILMVWSLNGTFGSGTSSRKDGKGTTIPGAAQLSAKDSVCQSNLGQIRMSLQIAHSSNPDGFPSSLSETRLAPDFLKCPLDHRDYVYDPTTGTVHCSYPGHEKY